MERLIIVRFSEIFLKGNNRSFFENLLIDNIKTAVAKNGCRVNKSRCRILIEGYNQNEEGEIIGKLKKVFGIHTISPVLSVETDIDKIFSASLNFVKDGTFKFCTSRADKTFYLNSMQVSDELGARLLQYNPALKVDVHKPDFTINVDIRENGRTFVFSDIVEGAHGMPSGCAGKGLLMLSGGIDSPVAGYLMARRGMKITAIHFYSYPYTSEYAKQKVITLCEKLSAYNGKTELLVVPFTEIQQEIHKNCPEEFMITIMRRFMMRIAEKAAFAEKAGAIINGESLGQVASQTLESITVTNNVVKLPVFRPLIGLDKLDIIEIAEKIGTYSTSILPYEDCCTVFLPKNPVIRPKMNIIERAESKLDIETLVNKAVEGIERITAES